MRLEMRPAEGGDEAVSFMHDFAAAITAHTATPAIFDGRNITFYRL